MKDDLKQNTVGLRVTEPVELRPVDRLVASKILFRGLLDISVKTIHENRFYINEKYIIKTY